MLVKKRIEHGMIGAKDKNMRDSSQARKLRA